MADELIFLHTGYTPRCHAKIAGFYNFYSIALLTKKSLEAQYDDFTCEMTGRWIWTVYPGSWTRIRMINGSKWWEHRFANFASPLPSRWITADIWLTHPQLASPEKDYESLFDEMIAYSQKLDRGSRMKATNIMEYILLTLAEERAQAARAEPWLEKTLQRLDECQDFAPNYTAIARECNMALSSLRRNFKHATGIPIHEHVMRQRMTTARRLLQESDLAIKTIALQLGYRDVHYFTRQFQRLCGATPAAYRRSARFS